MSDRCISDSEETFPTWQQATNQTPRNKVIEISRILRIPVEIVIT